MTNRPDRTELGGVIVSGGASGLGLAVAEAVAEAGGRPWILDIHPPPAELPHDLVDVSNRPAVERALRRAVEEVEPLTGVVTAAGVDACGPLEGVPAEEWERVITINLLGTAAVVRAALPFLRRDGGRVVTVASTLGLRALPDATAYCASKFGIVGLSRALAAETAGSVGVTTLVPGGMDTAFFDDRPEQYRPAPDARLNRPADVARAVLFALSQPPGCEIRELVVTPSVEPSWP